MMSVSKQRYIALTRGINVGGNSIIKMADLRSLLESIELPDVATYIQSGNVIFSAEIADREKLTKQIEQKLTSTNATPMKVFLLSQADLKEAVANNPFEPESRDKEQRCHFMFLSTEPNAANREALMKLQGEEYQFHVHDKVLYYAYSRKLEGRRRTIDFEKVLGVIGTSRSWKVVNNLIELSEGSMNA